MQLFSNCLSLLVKEKEYVWSAPKKQGESSIKVTMLQYSTPLLKKKKLQGYADWVFLRLRGCENRPARSKDFNHVQPVFVRTYDSPHFPTRSAPELFSCPRHQHGTNEIQRQASTTIHDQMLHDSV